MNGRPVKEYLGADDRSGFGRMMAEALERLLRRQDGLRRRTREARAECRARIDELLGAVAVANGDLRTADGFLVALGYSGLTLASFKEREAEQVKAGILDHKALDAAKQAAVPLEEHLAAYEQSLIAAEVSDMYRADVLRAVRRVAKDCAFATPADVNPEAVEKWLAARMTGTEKMRPEPQLLPRVARRLRQLVRPDGPAVGARTQPHPEGRPEGGPEAPAAGADRGRVEAVAGRRRDPPTDRRPDGRRGKQKGKAARN